MFVLGLTSVIVFSIKTYSYLVSDYDGMMQISDKKMMADRALAESASKVSTDRKGIGSVVR